MCITGGRLDFCKLNNYPPCISSISVSSPTTSVSNPVEVTINTTAIQVSNIISYQFNFDYDQTKLQYVGNSLVGTIAAGGSVIVNSSTPGHLIIGYMKPSQLTVAGEILKLQFNALAVGNVPLTISNFKYNKTPVICITNGSVTIKPIDIIRPTAAITYSDADGFVKIGANLIITATFNESMADSPKPQIVLSGANTLPATDMTKVSNTVYTFNYTVTNGRGTVNVSLVTGTDLAGNVVVATPTSGALFVVILMGDVNGDGLVGAYDAALVLQYSVGLNPLPTIDPLPWEAWRIATADVYNLPGVTAYDAALILQYSVGIITSLKYF
jgi:hypothetical protein